MAALEARNAIGYRVAQRHKHLTLRSTHPDHPTRSHPASLCLVPRVQGVEGRVCGRGAGWKGVWGVSSTTKTPLTLSSSYGTPLLLLLLSLSLRRWSRPVSYTHLRAHETEADL
eukprot:2035533-Rhodomonas_salina.1